MLRRRLRRAIGRGLLTALATGVCLAFIPWAASFSSYTSYPTDAAVGFFLLGCFFGLAATGTSLVEGAIADRKLTCTTSCMHGYGYGGGDINLHYPISGFSYLHRLGWVDSVSHH